jgi:hypothetical protein
MPPRYRHPPGHPPAAPQRKVKAGYHGYLLEPPFEPGPGRETWIPLEPKGQNLDNAIRDLVMEVHLGINESPVTREALTPHLSNPLVLIDVFREALRVGEVKLEDDGSDCLHWFLLRWPP